MMTSAISILRIALLFAALIRPAFPLPTINDMNAQVTMTDSREKLPGDNVAYYCSIPSDQQLFEIEEFTIASNPPIP